MKADNREAILDETERARLPAFADWLIAGGSGLPSASGADPDGTWFERALAVRPDLVPVVRETLSGEGEAGGVLDRLRNEDRAKFDAFAYIVAGAYLMNPRIRRSLGYAGPTPTKNPAFPDEGDSCLEGDILDPVIRRGPIYRSAPGPASPTGQGAG